MLEELCRQSFWDACKDVTEKNYNLVRLKSTYSERKAIEYRYAEFFEFQTVPRHNWSDVPFKKMNVRRDAEAYHTRQRSWVWFNEHSNALRDHFIRARYRGSVAAAMDTCGTFGALYDEFLRYFNERRTKLMNDTNQMIAQRKKELARQGKHIQSHGGVANLLKVLTKTMHEQGNSIYTIAKVQYQICMQAGIYIPDEFLTDILVAGDMVQEG